MLLRPRKQIIASYNKDRLTINIIDARTLALGAPSGQCRASPCHIRNIRRLKGANVNVNVHTRCLGAGQVDLYFVVAMLIHFYLAEQDPLFKLIH